LTTEFSQLKGDRTGERRGVVGRCLLINKKKRKEEDDAHYREQ